MNQSQIDSKLAKIKSWYEINHPLCIFCGHRVGKDGQLAHLVRRSETRSEMQVNKLNTGLAHPSCHEIFDNDRIGTIFLPRFYEVMYIIYLLDPEYFMRISSYYPDHADLFDRFPDLPFKNIKHHGQLLHLGQYIKESR